MDVCPDLCGMAGGRDHTPTLTERRMLEEMAAQCGMCSISARLGKGQAGALLCFREGGMGAM